MTTIRCRVSAEVKGVDPPANGAGLWVQVQGPGAFRPLYASEEFERSFWTLAEEALLQEEALDDGAGAIIAEAFGEERLLGAHVRRCDGQPTQAAIARGRANLERLGVIPPEESGR